MEEKTPPYGNGDHVSEKDETPSVMIDGGISLDRDSQLERGLKSRHIQFLALGGA